MVTVEDLRRLTQKYDEIERHVSDSKHDLTVYRRQLAELEPQVRSLERGIHAIEIDLPNQERQLQDTLREAHRVERELERQRLEYHGPEGYDARAKVGLYPA